MAPASTNAIGGNYEVDKDSSTKEKQIFSGRHRLYSETDK